MEDGQVFAGAVNQSVSGYELFVWPVQLRHVALQAKTAQEILDRLKSGSADEKKPALTQLSKLSVDNTFAQEFINKKGLHLIISMVESGSWLVAKQNNIKCLRYSLKTKR